MKNSGFKILVSPIAQKEIIEAIEFYQSRSKQAPAHFIQSVENSYKRLKLNPNYSIRYKNVRSVKINKFPFSLFFVILEKDKTIEIISCFHNKRNPKRKP
jgi:plasmid stabilization system protein ParE